MAFGKNQSSEMLRIIIISFLFVCCAFAKPSRGRQTHHFYVVEPADSDEQQAGTYFDENDVEDDNNFEDDMILTPEQKEFFRHDLDDEAVDDPIERVGRLDLKYRWPKNAKGKVVVPYTIDENSGFCE